MQSCPCDRLNHFNLDELKFKLTNISSLTCSFTLQLYNLFISNYFFSTGIGGNVAVDSFVAASWWRTVRFDLELLQVGFVILNRSFRFQFRHLVLVKWFFSTSKVPWFHLTVFLGPNWNLIGIESHLFNSRNSIIVKFLWRGGHLVVQLVLRWSFLFDQTKTYPFTKVLMQPCPCDSWSILIWSGWKLKFI